jgi:hypothetical protein
MVCSAFCSSFRCCRRPREQGDADGGAQADLLVIEVERPRGRRGCWSQFGRFVGLLDIGLHQGELVAARPRQGAQAAAVGAQAVGQGQQQLVTDR